MTLMQVEESVIQLQQELTQAREELRALEARLASLQADEERNRQAEALQAFAAGVYAAKGDAFFSVVGQTLAEALPLEGVVIARLVDQEEPLFQTLAMVSGGRLVDNISFRVAGTPSEGLLHSRVCVYADGVCDSFPDNAQLAEHGIESFVGVPLVGADGRVLGLISAMSRSPLHDTAYVVSLLQLAAKPVQAELERRVAQETLASHAAELECAYARLREKNALTEQVVAERTRELAKEKAQTEAMIAHMPVAMVFLDCDLVIRWASPLVFSLLGLAPEHVLHRPLGELSPLDVEPDGLLSTVLACGKPQQVHGIGMPFSLEGREVGFWDVTYVPTLDADGKAIGVLAMGNEVSSVVETERQQSERITQLEDLDQLKRDFVNTVSHELRTPLTSIMGFAEFLEDEVGGPLTESQGLYVEQILDGARRLRGIVDDLLDFSRMEASGLSMVKSEQDLIPVLAEEVASLVPQAQDGDVRIETSWPEGPLFMRLDHRRIGQVVLNLVGNAIKFTPAGGRVSVCLTVEQDCVRVTVQDTGIGIGPTHLPHLFTKFYQVDPSMTREHGGTGLGLAIAKAMVEAHGGEIGAESRPGHGSTFWFTLPRG
jgi:signal transduction histidine kinase